jgi:hypothetical protein
MSHIENNRENQPVINLRADFLSNSYVISNPTLLENQLKELTTKKGYNDPDVLKLQIELLDIKLEKNLIGRSDFYNEFSTIEKRIDRLVGNFSIQQALQLNSEKTRLAITAYPKFLNNNQVSISFISYLAYLNSISDQLNKLDKSDIITMGRDFFDVAKSFAERGIKRDAYFNEANKIYKLILDHDIPTASFLFGEYNLVLNKLNNAEDLLKRANKFLKNNIDLSVDAFLDLKIASKLSLVYVMQADNVSSITDKKIYIDKSEELAIDTMRKIKQLNSDIESLSDDLLDLYNESWGNLIKGYLVLGKNESAIKLSSNSTFQKSKYNHPVQELLKNFNLNN